MSPRPSALPRRPPSAGLRGVLRRKAEMRHKKETETTQRGDRKEGMKDRTERNPRANEQELLATLVAQRRRSRSAARSTQKEIDAASAHGNR
jgi:hypothetical protein